MVQCCSDKCERSWYHLACVDLQEAPEGDWYCCNTCETDDSYITASAIRRREERWFNAQEKTFASDMNGITYYVYVTKQSQVTTRFPSYSL